MSGTTGEFASDQDDCPAYHNIGQPQYEKFRVRVSIYQCSSLPPADQEGHSDPYVEVYNPYDTARKDNIRTKQLYDTNNPIFY